MDASLLEQLRSILPPAIIAVSGFGGSGKSSLAAWLGQHVNAPVISVDSFIKDKHLVGYTRWEWIDYDRLEQEVLVPFFSGAKLIEFGHFDWNTNKIDSLVTLRGCPQIVVEGVGLFRPSLLKYLTLSIWVGCSLEEAIRRGKKRDREVYNNPQDENWDGIWRRNDEEFYRIFRPDQTADIVYDNAAATA